MQSLARQRCVPAKKVRAKQTKHEQHNILISASHSEMASRVLATQGLAPALLGAVPTGVLSNAALFIDLALKEENLPTTQAMTKSGIIQYRMDDAEVAPW